MKTEQSPAYLAVLLLGIVLTACITPVEPTGQGVGSPEWEENGQVNLIVHQEDSPLDLAQGGVETWLSQYLQANTPLDARLEGYRIDGIEAVSDPFFAGEYDFVFRIEYSVHPSPSGFGRWVAGDGREGQDGWVEGKIHYVGIRVVDETATIFILGPCPMC